MTETPVQPQSAQASTPSSSQSAPAFELVSREWLNQLQEQTLRLRADFDNFRKRQLKEREETIKYANEGLLTDLLPVLDNFELGMKAAQTSTDAKTIAQGLSMVLTQLQRVLSDAGVKSIEAMGQPFNPNLHEAVAKKETTEAAEGTVLEQHRKGYQLHNRLLRPASVVVAQIPTSHSTK
jgi:molecular chaperone GrpE